MARNELSREVVRYALVQQTGERLCVATLGLLGGERACFSLDAGDALAEALELGIPNLEQLGDFAERLHALDTPLVRYLQARLFARCGDLSRAVEALTSCIESLPTLEPFLYGLRARWLLREGRVSDAGVDLRTALLARPEYGFFVRSERLFRKVIDSAHFKPRRELRVALLASSTTALLAPVLQAVCFGRGVRATVYEAPYGNYRQEILDSTSGLYQFRPDVVVLMISGRDLNLRPDGSSGAAEAFVHELRSLWATLQSRHPCHLIQLGLEVPRENSWTSLEDALPQGRRRVVRHANALLAQELPAGVSFLDVGLLSTSIESLREWHSSRQFPRTALLPKLAETLAGHCLAAFGLSAKVLVLDLDNTLWGGVIGEDGLVGIRLGPGTPTGEAYVELQRRIRELHARGVLLAVCSKNNLADAEAPFRSHSSMVLKREDFIAFRANWEDKATNIRALAAELALGLDSFVFLDDNPFERAWVRKSVPEVTVLEAGTTPWDMLDQLEATHLFEATVLTVEDRERHLSYHASAALRASASGVAGSLDEFLRDLGMSVAHGPVNSETLVRVTQLVNKTNQFNLRTQRYSVEQLKQIAESREWWTQWFRLSDRYGDHGLIGVVMARIKSDHWYIDNWLMSCRVLGRRVEDFMCSCLLTAAASAGAKYVLGEYIRTEKNVMVSELYPKLGFTATQLEGGFRRDLAVAFPQTPWIATGGAIATSDGK